MISCLPFNVHLSFNSTYLKIFDIIVINADPVSEFVFCVLMFFLSHSYVFVLNIYLKRYIKVNVFSSIVIHYRSNKSKNRQYSINVIYLISIRFEGFCIIKLHCGNAADRHGSRRGTDTATQPGTTCAR